MKSQGLRGVGNALAVALISIGLMVGALSISLVEFVPQVTPTAAVDNQIPSPIPLTATNTLAPTLTPTLGLKSPTPSNTPTSTITSTPPASCLPPGGWGQIVIQADDTLDNIASRYRVSTVELRLANCLLSDSLMAGTVLYAPSVETSTPFVATNTPFVTTNTPAICSPGATGWVKNYKVKPGDTFYSIAFNYYTTQTQLKSVNCYTSDFLSVGEILWIPNFAPRTPTQRPTLMPSVTATIYLTKPFTETTLPFTTTVLPYTITVIPSNTPDPASFDSMQTVTAVPTP